ncbi:hypothetical protein BHM03_00052190 [Ensete ventricosum]|nr:hypothetical protein BHM03_00052190 [Ensete ventricosum]
MPRSAPARCRSRTHMLSTPSSPTLTESLDIFNNDLGAHRLQLESQCLGIPNHSPRSMSAALSSSLQHYSTSLSAASKYFTSASKLVARLSVAAIAFGPTPDYNS